MAENKDQYFNSNALIKKVASRKPGVSAWTSQSSGEAVIEELKAYIESERKRTKQAASRSGQS